ncbi:MAG: polymerase III subunit beta protein [candidate division TM6 bacterium GW2011_GWF2_32_72]|nr:MAG: polymerase III subunit beta protein [candidate division TM6 bacterium GW2011_GWF2_32_72]
MKKSFVVLQKDLLLHLSAMQPICSKRTTLDATSYILMQVGYKELILKSTDLEISLQSSCILENSNLDEPQTILVSGKRLFDLVKELDGAIEFEIASTQLTVKSGGINVSLNIKSSEEFPPFPERIENLMDLQASFLVNMLNRVAFLIPQNNSNPALNGLFLEINSKELKMTTTDGHCLAQAKTEKCKLSEGEKKWLLPKRAIIEVKKLLEQAKDASVFLGECGNQLVFSGEQFNFFTKLLAQSFPEYSPILNKTDFIPARLAKNDLVKSLRRSNCLLSGQFIATKFEFEKEALNVYMQNKEVGELKEKLNLEEFTGSKLDIRFYAPYLLSGLQAFDEEQINFSLRDNSRPIIFESDKDDCKLIYLVMPVSPTNI